MFVQILVSDRGMFSTGNVVYSWNVCSDHTQMSKKMLNATASLNQDRGSKKRSGEEVRKEESVTKKGEMRESSKLSNNNRGGQRRMRNTEDRMKKFELEKRRLKSEKGPTCPFTRGLTFL
ncbi:uncharacterized protein LOC112495002 [Cephus cinctus]|uniref:Uncharacterized protein LOC112495002 n=1 Tax=Cephus cinctus TaxID=211228 RepID=A0AAJ7RQD6_CEPCN|nr:uncharacterized protein LOC112495002 [Cephus cinctus]